MDHRDPPVLLRGKAVLVFEPHSCRKAEKHNRSERICGRSNCFADKAVAFGQILWNNASGRLLKSVRTPFSITAFISVTGTDEHKGEAAVDPAAGSIPEQTNVDLRLNLCDDASTDGSWERIWSWGNGTHVVCLRNEDNLRAGGADP